MFSIRSLTALVNFFLLIKRPLACVFREAKIFKHEINNC